MDRSRRKIGITLKLELISNLFQNICKFLNHFTRTFFFTFISFYLSLQPLPLPHVYFSHFSIILTFSIFFPLFLSNVWIFPFIFSHTYRKYKYILSTVHHLTIISILITIQHVILCPHVKFSPTILCLQFLYLTHVNLFYSLYISHCFVTLIPHSLPDIDYVFFWHAR